MSGRGYSHLFKIIVAGPQESGKSALLASLKNKKVPQQYAQTIGVEFDSALFPVEGESQPVKLQIWDVAGDERFVGITQSYYVKSHAFILVVDTSKKPEDQQARLQNYIRSYSTILGPDHKKIIYLVPTKADLSRDSDDSSPARLEQLAENLRTYCEQQSIEADIVLSRRCSALTREGVEDTFQDIAEGVYQRTVKKEAKEERSQGYAIRRPPSFASQNKSTIGWGIGLPTAVGLIAGGASGGASATLAGMTGAAAAVAIGGITFGIGIVIFLVVICCLYAKHKRETREGFARVSTESPGHSPAHSRAGSRSPSPGPDVQLGEFKQPFSTPHSSKKNKSRSAAAASRDSGSDAELYDAVDSDDEDQQQTRSHGHSHGNGHGRLGGP